MPRKELFEHPKFARFARLIGEPKPHALGHLEYLWRVAYGTGDPIIGDAVDVEVAAEWDGPPGLFARSALEARFLDQLPDGRLQVHDLIDHAPTYVKDRFRMREWRAEQRSKNRQMTVTEHPPECSVTVTELSPLAEQSIVEQNYAAAETPPKKRDSSVTANSQTAAAAEEDARRRKALQERLIRFGVPPGHALEWLTTIDPGLIAAAIEFAEAERSTLTRPMGALKTMLLDPGRWGFQKQGDAWLLPPPGQKRMTKEDVAERQRQRERQLEEERTANTARYVNGQPKPELRPDQKEAIRQRGSKTQKPNP